jgi:hypothetical protein
MNRRSGEREKRRYKMIRGNGEPEMKYETEKRRVGEWKIE